MYYSQEIMYGMKELRIFVQVLIGSCQMGKSTLTGQVLAKLKAPHFFLERYTISNIHAKETE
jgi:translation elongation factor EF-1alpha